MFRWIKGLDWLGTRYNTKALLRRQRSARGQLPEARVARLPASEGLCRKDSIPGSLFWRPGSRIMHDPVPPQPPLYNGPTVTSTRLPRRTCRQRGTFHTEDHRSTTTAEWQSDPSFLTRLSGLTGENHGALFAFSRLRLLCRVSGLVLPLTSFSSRLFWVDIR
jgi:hypothetical protein